MAITASAPWHKESYDKFIDERLPSLLAERLPLSGYKVDATGEYTCKVNVAVSSGNGKVSAMYEAIPRPDPDGVFTTEDICRVVLPVASEEDLEKATVSCVGEQLHDYVAQRLGDAPDDVSWDESLLRSFLPLDTWIRGFLAGASEDRWALNVELDASTALLTSQPLDDCNWLARQAHLRRIMIRGRKRLITPSQFSRTCPFETPEGPNIGRILHVAVGATISDGRLIITHDQPEASLGLTASMVPFLEHNDPNRQLMGVNMMRQWFTPPDPEPAYVQTGNEADAPGVWCGKNLLTAFIPLGADTFEDGIVISESAAKRLDYPHPIEPGDKLSNRHGTKGTVSRILPDAEMPHLEDGKPVELVFSFIGIHTRLNFGQIREAIVGRLARHNGRSVIVRPFHAPTEEELRKELVKAGLPETGMEKLALGANGKKLRHLSTVGWVYWGKTYHVAREKIHASVMPKRCNLQSEYEYYQLRELGAFETIAETFNTRSQRRDDAETLAEQVAAGEVQQAGAPSPKFVELTRRLNCLGIRACFDGRRISFEFAASQGKKLKLACPIAHPWLPECGIEEVGTFEIRPEYPSLLNANTRMQDLLKSEAPPSLLERAKDKLARRLSEWASALLDAYDTEWTRRPGPVRFGDGVMFSGRTVICPGGELHIDQVGLAEEIAWTLFGPVVQRETGNEREVRQRSEKATRALDNIMAKSWVIVNRAPTIMPTSLLAFRPVRIPENVIRLHPLATRLMNADFDGDQVAVFLPITEAGQREARELLSVEGHLRRNPDLVKWLVHKHEILWGLASLSLQPEGPSRIADLAGFDVDMPEGFVTHESVVHVMRELLDREGASNMLEVLERLTRLGFDIARLSGASISPFVGHSLDVPPEPKSEDPDEWQVYCEQIVDRMISKSNYQDDDLGPQLLAVKSEARGTISHLASLVAPRVLDLSFGPAEHASDFEGFPFIRRRGLRHGLTPEELFASVVPARIGIAMIALECAREGYGIRKNEHSKGFTVLARAMRAEHPGIVFAQAAATGETDPLTDLDSRLFVGLQVGRCLAI